MQKQAIIAVVALWMLMIVGCGEPQLDLKEYVDTRVETEWMVPGKYLDAGEFFADGGHYYNRPEFPGLTQLDKPYIIPLLEDLRNEFQLKQYAIIMDNPKVAWSVVMRLPEGSGKREAIRNYLDEADEEFPGMILQEWGYEWLSLDFLDEEEAAFIRDGQES